MRVLLLSFAFLLSITQLYGEGYQVEVHLKNQKILEGELVSVTDSSLYIPFFVDYIPDTLDEMSYDIYLEEIIREIPNDSIQKIVIPGESYILEGMTIGFITGLLGTMFAVMASSNEGGGEVLAISDSGIAAVMGLFGTVILTIAGGVYGAIASTSDIIIEPYPNPDINLEPYTRIQNEPKFLRE